MEVSMKTERQKSWRIGVIAFVSILAVLLAASSLRAQEPKAIDLGTYPGGTWAEGWDINDFGVVVGLGDIPGGNTRPIGVALRGSRALQWFDLGTLGGERTDSWVMCMEIANTGLIVGHAPTQKGDVHAFAWTPKSKMVDIGTLEGHINSAAFGVNKLGSLIVGWSGVELWGSDALPVAWTSVVAWTPNGPTVSWKIHKLDTEGFDSATAWTVNDFGQIVGEAWDNSAQVNVGVLWNPVAGGKGWKVMRLEASPDYPNGVARDINELGEIVGLAINSDWSTALPALWKPATLLRRSWNLTVLPTLSGLSQGWNPALGINDAGNIVGVSNDADGNWLAARWSTKDPQFIQVLGFPGDWSVAVKVNNNGIAVGGFGVGDGPEHAAAVRFR